MKNRQTNGSSHSNAGFLHSKRFRYALLAIAAASVLVIVAAAMRQIIDNREYRKLYNAAQDSYIAQNYESALGSLRRAAEIEERDDCLLLTADCYTAMGYYEKALEILEGMDVRDANVSSRISKIQGLIEQRESSENVIVAGRVYELNTKTVVLNGLSLSDSIFDEVSVLYSLDSLSIADNNIEHIDAISALGGLITLDLSGNNIADISPLASLGSLRTLYLDGNPIIDFSPLYSLQNLATLSIKNIQLSDSQLSELSNALPNCAIHGEKASNDVLDITLGGYTFKSDVTELDLSNLSIKDISALSNCKNLTKLLLNGNDISDLSPLMDIPWLNYLDISDNEITDLRPLMGIQQLTHLDVSYNYVSSTVSLGNLIKLRELILDANPINDFSGIRKLKSLSSLSLSDTGLDDSSLGYLSEATGLLLLDIRNNPALTGEAVDGLKASLYSCRILNSDLPYSIIIGDRSFKNSDTHIDISSLGITDISQVASFLRPEYINLSNNSVSNIYQLQYCTSLKTLNLAGNLIDDIAPLAKLTSLEVLDLSNNYVTNLSSLFYLKNLRSLNLSGNSLMPEQIEELHQMLPDCTIYF